MPEPNSKQPSCAACKFHREQLLPALRPQLQTNLPKQSLLWWPELNRLTDDSSFLKEGERKAGGAAVVDGQDIIWAAALLPGTSAQMQN